MKKINREQHCAFPPYGKEGRAGRGLWLLLGVAVALGGWARPARAELGGDVSTVAADQAHMKASLRIMRSANYSVHEMQIPSGTVVREYASTTGKIFGVAWSGPWMPDLRQLFGAYFESFTQAVQARKAVTGVRARGPIAIEQPGLVVYSGGHQRGFSGRAYMPEMLPEGVTAKDIR